MAGKIFINYRREDEQGFALRLYETLADSFGKERLFYDLDSIPWSSDFVDHIEGQIRLSDVLLVIVGRKWLDVVDEHDRLRLDNPNDWVRTEIRSAIEQNKRVLPVIVHGAPVPLATQLPDDLQKLARLNAFFAPNGGSRVEFGNLIEWLRKTLAEIEEKRLEEQRAAERAQAERQRKAEERAARKRAQQQEARAREREAAEAKARAEQEAAERERLARAEREAAAARARADEAAERERRAREEAEAAAERERLALAARGAAEAEARAAETAEKERLEREAAEAARAGAEADDGSRILEELREIVERRPEPRAEIAAPQRSQDDLDRLQALSQEIVKAVDTEIGFELGRRYLGGERDALSRRLYTAAGQQTFDAVLRRYRDDGAFRADAARFCADFEALAAESAGIHGGESLLRDYLISDTGKIFLTLAHLREEGAGRSAAPAPGPEGQEGPASEAADGPARADEAEPRQAAAGEAVDAKARAEAKAAAEEARRAIRLREAAEVKAKLDEQRAAEDERRARQLAERAEEEARAEAAREKLRQEEARRAKKQEEIRKADEDLRQYFAQQRRTQPVTESNAGLHWSGSQPSETTDERIVRDDSGIGSTSPGSPAAAQGAIGDTLSDKSEMVVGSAEAAVPPPTRRPTNNLFKGAVLLVLIVLVGASMTLWGAGQPVLYSPLANVSLPASERLGFAYRNASAATVSEYGFTGKNSFFEVTRVDGNSPARNARLREGDLILLVDGIPFADAENFELYLRKALDSRRNEIAIKIRDRYATTPTIILQVDY